jgi:hypothetical protein
MRIAYFLRNLDLLFSKEKNIFAIFPKESEEERIAIEEFKLKNVIPIKINKGIFSQLNLEEILKFSDLEKKLKERKIDAIWLTRSSKFLENWARKNKIILISQDYRLREKFENKIYFEKFLERNYLPHLKSRVLSSKIFLPFKKSVFQIPNSTGGEGTFVIKNKKDLKIIKKIKKPLLVREYKCGMSLGVSFLIEKKEIYFSALDRQCFLKKERLKIGSFLGIQWLPFNFFEKKVYKKIEEKLKELALKLKKENLKGIVNVDFILDRDEIFFLECNPRLTAATPQIFSNLGLIGKEPFSLPKNSFSGSYMVVSLLKPKKIENLIPGGFYILEKNKLKKISLKNRFEFLKLKNGLLFYNEANKGENFKKPADIGTILSNFALFDFKSGKLNKKGKIVFDFFHNV